MVLPTFLSFLGAIAGLIVCVIGFSYPKKTIIIRLMMASLGIFIFTLNGIQIWKQPIFEKEKNLINDSSNMMYHDYFETGLKAKKAMFKLDSLSENAEFENNRKLANELLAKNCLLLSYQKDPEFGKNEAKPNEVIRLDFFRHISDFKEEYHSEKGQLTTLLDYLQSTNYLFGTEFTPCNYTEMIEFLEEQEKL